MTLTAALHKQIVKRLREKFGEPETTLARDDHWAIKPDPYKLAINVLVNGTAEIPAIWVFDPHDPDEPVMMIGIQNEVEIDEFIEAIHDRLIRARSFMHEGRDLAHELNNHPLVRTNGLKSALPQRTPGIPGDGINRSRTDGSTTASPSKPGVH